MRLNASRPLTIEGQTFQLCDKLSRRSFLPIGGLAMGGLSLPGAKPQHDLLGVAPPIGR